MKTLWRGLIRTLFWSYERGSWPYDVMVVVIVLFVLLTPRGWFHDQPRSASPSSSGVSFVTEDANSGTQTYRVDARLLPLAKESVKSDTELERETHEILSRSVDALKGRMFQVRRISAVKSQDGSVQYYEVEVAQ
jgi:hypothetical protein